MIYFKKDGKVDRVSWPKPQFPGDMTDVANRTADALDIAVAALRSIKMCAMETDVETVAIEALRQIGADHAD